jgi:hypothetical protein
VEPTFRRAEVLAIAVVGFDRTRIRSQRVLWDHATLAGQLGLATRAGQPGLHAEVTGRAASAPAR